MAKMSAKNDAVHVSSCSEQMPLLLPGGFLVMCSSCFL